MENHQKILDKIKVLDLFLQDLNLIRVEKPPKNWDLDSYYLYEPIQKPFYLIVSNTTKRLKSIRVYLVGGITLTVYNESSSDITIRTDYSFNSFFDLSSLKQHFRNWKIDKLFIQ